MPQRQVRTQAEFDAWAADLRRRHPEMFGTATHTTVARTQRHRWEPRFARHYGVMPWDMGRLTWREYKLMEAEADALVEVGRG